MQRVDYCCMGLRMTERTIVRGWKAAGRRVGKSPVQLWRDVRDGKFPAPIELGPNSVGWFDDEIIGHLESRPRRSYGGKAAA
jgi:predicted DNA-binding transcriptional regulator AlpA